MRTRIRYHSSGGDAGALAMFGTFGAIGLAAVAAYFTHIWWIIGMLMADQPLYGGKVAIAILGLFVPPFGVLHGIWLCRGFKSRCPLQFDLTPAPILWFSEIEMRCRAAR